METYSITSSSSLVQIPRPFQSVTAEVKHEEQLYAAGNYLQSGSEICSAEGLCYAVTGTKGTDMDLNSAGGDHSGITSENTGLKLGAWDDVDRRRHGHNEAMKLVGGGNDGDEGDDEVKDGVNGGRRKGEKRVRRPRFAFHTRSQVDILDDGYRWRKYGQKAVKNNNFPRSYYRCTHQGCNVKKQVQRLSKDEEVVVTTYEGTHTHPIERNNDNFEQILNQMQIYTRF